MAEKYTFMQKVGLLQAKLKPVKKTEINPHFKSRYVDINGVLEMVKPALDEVGLVLMQPLTTHEGRPSITTILQDPDSEGEITSYFMLPEVADPQKMGAAITYLRRFAIVSLLCLEAEDNDGEEVRGMEMKPIVATDYVQKMQEGRNNAIGSKCPKCGVGQMKTSKTGSLYCDKLCWKNGTPIVEVPTGEDTEIFPF